jgi:two-component system NtrC family sensor kinase
MKRLINGLQDTALLWEVLDGLHLPALAINREFMITDCNASVKTRLFFHKHEIGNLPVFDLITVSPSFQRDSLKKKYSVLEGRCLRKDRETFPARISFIKHADGFIVVVEDRSEIIKIETRARHRKKEMNTFNALSETLSSATELREMVKGALDTLLNAMNCGAAWIYLKTAPSEDLRICRLKGENGIVFEDAEVMRPYECFIERVFLSGKALLVKNVLDDPRVSSCDVMGPGFNSIGGVPLVVRDIGDAGSRVAGVLGIADRTDDYFTSLDIQFLTAVGNQIAVAIENARLIAGLKEKVKQIELINEISSVVNSSLSIGHIFRLVFSEIKKMIDFDRASINLLDESRSVLEIIAIDTKRPTKLTKGVVSPTDKTSSGWVTVNQKPWINHDLQKKISFPYDSALLAEGIRSTISVPLYKDRPLGALNFDSIFPEKYSEKDLGILLPIAKHLSVALENALLFEEISKEKREWEKTFDAITDMVWIEDLKGKVLRVNKAVIEKSGKAEISLIQKRTDELLKILQITGGADLSSESVECERKLFKEVKGLSGSIYYFWTYPLLNSDGNTYGVVNYLRDVTEQKKLEQQLVRADKLASLGMLVAGVVHEINNPLGIIAGYSEALLDRAGDPGLRALNAFEDFPEYLETINNEIFRCKDRLKGLLDFARTSSGNYRKIDINGLIKEVTLLVKHGAKTHNHRIELDLQREIPETVADPGAMRQLFINIIMNSLYFIGPEGKIVVSTSYEKDPCCQDSICIRISDNGRGIKRDVIDKIFDPFFSTKAVGEGTGLGLSICHRIVSEHGGTIDVESREGAGTKFIIKIPVREKKS